MFDLEEEEEDKIQFIHEEEYEDEDIIGFSKDDFAPSGHVPSEPIPWDPYEFNFFSHIIIKWQVLSQAWLSSSRLNLSTQ